MATVPTSQQALDALAVAELHKVGVSYRPAARKWVAVAPGSESILRTAGAHDDAWAALLAAKTAIEAGESRRVRAAADSAIDFLSSSGRQLRHRLEPRLDPEGNPVDVRVWFAAAPDGTDDGMPPHENPREAVTLAAEEEARRIRNGAGAGNGAGNGERTR